MGTHGIGDAVNVHLAQRLGEPLDRRGGVGVGVTASSL